MSTSPDPVSDGHAAVQARTVRVLVVSQAVGAVGVTIGVATASLLHVVRADLPTVLTRLAAVTRGGGLLRLAVEEGDGEGWSTHGSIRGPRHFTYWRPDALREVLVGAGWVDVSIVRVPGKGSEQWLEVVAVHG